MGIWSQSLESRRDIEQSRAPHRQPGERQGRSPSTSVNRGREWQTLPLLGLAGAIPPFTTTSRPPPPTPTPLPPPPSPSSISSPAQPAVCGYSRSIKPQIDPATSPVDQGLAPNPCQQCAAADDPALTAAGSGAATCSALLSKDRKCGTEGSVDRTKNSPLRGGDSEVQLPLLTYNSFPRREARRATRESKITEHTHPHQLGNGCLYRNFEMKHAGTGRSRYFLAGKGCDQYQPAYTVR